MTDQKPTGVFVRLPLSNEQIGKLLAPISTLDGRLLSIGTPVQTRELTVVTTLGTLRDPIPCVRQSEAQALLAARDAEIVRLRDALEDAKRFHEEQDKAFSKQPPSAQGRWHRHQHREQIESIEEALKGPAA